MPGATTAYRDPENTAFRHEGAWYRVAAPASADALDALRNGEMYERWIADDRLVAFEEATAGESARVLEAFGEASPRQVRADSRVFRVEELSLVTYPWEWPDPLFVNAARLTLDLREELLDIGLDLKDGSALNVQFQGVTPRFVDLGSIEAWRPNPSWNANRQFVEHFVNPLAVASSARVSAAQAWRLGGHRGLRSDVARSLMRGLSRFRPSLWLLQASTQPKGTAGPAESRYSVEGGNERELARRATSSLNDRLRRQVEALASTNHETTWADYGSREHYTAEELQDKVEMTKRFVAAEPDRGRLVLDVGGNDGLVAHELRSGPAEQVVVLDGDPGALDHLVARVTNDPQTARSVTPLFGDITDLTPDSGLLQREFAGFVDRVRPTAVLCQAVLHHVVITQGVPMRSAIEALASFGAPLLVEFAKEDDPKVQLLLSQIPNWSGSYDTDTLLDALSACYENVRPVGGTTSTRLIVEADSIRRRA